MSLANVDKTLVQSTNGRQEKNVYYYNIMLLLEIFHSNETAMTRLFMYGTYVTTWRKYYNIIQLVIVVRAELIMQIH